MLHSTACDKIAIHFLKHKKQMDKLGQCNYFESYAFIFFECLWPGMKKMSVSRGTIIECKFYF